MITLPSSSPDAPADAAVPPVSPHVDRRAHTATRVFLVSLVVLALLQMGVNFAVNPGGAFRESGLLLTSVRSTYAYQKLEALDAFLERTRGSELTIALGSSRMLVMPGPEDDENSAYFFNAAIDGGKAEDVLAFTRYILQWPDVSVQRVYINPDLQLLGEGETPDYGDRLEGSYALARELETLDGWDGRLTILRNGLVSSDWLISLAEHLIGAQPTTLPFDRDTGIAIEDGYFAHRIAARKEGRTFLDEDEAAIQARVLDTELSSKRMRDLEEAVGLWRDHGAEVVLIFMPRAANVWTVRASMPAFQELVTVVDRSMLALAADPLVVYCDFADPASVGVENERYWWDGGHYTAEAGRIIFDRAQQCASEQLQRDRSRD